MHGQTEAAARADRDAVKREEGGVRLLLLLLLLLLGGGGGDGVDVEVDGQREADGHAEHAERRRGAAIDRRRHARLRRPPRGEVRAERFRRLDAERGGGREVRGVGGHEESLRVEGERERLGFALVATATADGAPRRLELDGELRGEGLDVRVDRDFDDSVGGARRRGDVDGAR